MEDARNKMMEKYGSKEVGGIFREYLKKKKKKVWDLSISFFSKPLRFWPININGPINSLLFFHLSLHQ